ncbi:hypothetical protein ACMAZD_05860 [Vibrio sp. nBUS_14]|uniref:hypothetical protein n=1 Tax=Vibrio sp. nBUS_14 TaxID=3395321 RepID=UPI003EB7DDDB
MSTGLKTYTTTFVLFGSIAYWLFVNDQELMMSFKTLLNVVCTAVISLLSVLLFYVYQQMRVVKAIPGLGSKETAQVGQFSIMYNRRLFLTFSFYGFMLLSGVVLGNLTFKDNVTLLFLMSGYSGLLFVQMATLLSIYNLLKSIEIFDSYIHLRQAKLREKERAMDLLMAKENFSSDDKTYFNRSRHVINELPKSQ